METIKKQYKAKIVLQGQNKIVMPGLINGHTHAAMTLFRGIADDYPLFEWLNNYIFPAEVAFVDKEFVEIECKKQNHTYKFSIFQQSCLRFKESRNEGYYTSPKKIC